MMCFFFKIAYVSNHQKLSTDSWLELYTSLLKTAAMDFFID